jgi:hypothetical protein
VGLWCVGITETQIHTPTDCTRWCYSVYPIQDIVICLQPTLASDNISERLYREINSKSAELNHTLCFRKQLQAWVMKVWAPEWRNGRKYARKSFLRVGVDGNRIIPCFTKEVIACKTSGFHGGDYEEWRLLGHKNPVRTSQETHYVSTTEPSRLMLCKIWGFHGGDYEEWRILGHKNPVRTSQETRYISTTEPSRLMLCKIWGFHGGDYVEWRLLI